MSEREYVGDEERKAADEGEVEGHSISSDQLDEGEVEGHSFTEDQLDEGAASAE